jgi:hypothetical protein
MQSRLNCVEQTCRQYRRWWDKPSRDLLLELANEGKEWKDIGTELGVDEHDLKRALYYGCVSPPTFTVRFSATFVTSFTSTLHESSHAR